MIRVVLVDDHQLVRMGFRMLLGNAQIEVVGEFDSGEQACAEVARLAPDATARTPEQQMAESQPAPPAPSPPAATAAPAPTSPPAPPAAPRP